MNIREQLENSGILSNPYYIKYNRYIVPAAVAVIALLIAVLVTIPQLLRLFETFETINKLTEQRDFYREKAASLQNMNLAEYQGDLDVALIALPVDKDIPGVTGEVLSALSGSGTSLDGITFSNTAAESEKVEEFGMRVDVSGTQDTIKNFLDRIKVTPRIIKLSSIETGTGRDGQISASIGLVTLYQQLPGNIGAVDEPLSQVSKEDAQILADIKVRARSLPTVNSSGSTSGAGPLGKLNPFAP